MAPLKPDLHHEEATITDDCVGTVRRYQMTAYWVTSLRVYPSDSLPWGRAVSELISRSLEAAQPGFTKLTNHSVPLMSGSNLGLKPVSKKNIAFHHKSVHSVLWLFFVSSKEDITAFRVICRWLFHQKGLMLTLSVLIIIRLSQVWCLGRASSKLQGGTYLVKIALIIIIITIKRRRRRS